MTKRLFEKDVYLKEADCKITGKSELDGSRAWW